ncbi:sigma-70 family RNA polymerase sigma factor [Amycolatopsis sp. NPDC047767]|uniref:RNA polymerase sigma factor n=1 Tax=Amycolatopsis sp. NPDC047767 TaxID=3156765 RepID=UPI003451B879
MTAGAVGGGGLVGGRSFDPESAAWVRDLSPGSPKFQDACRRLYGLLVKIARREARRRSSILGLAGPEFDDVAHQAAADALVRITRKIGEFRGDAQFKTWAYKFVMREVAVKVGRHAWRDPRVSLGGDGTRLAPASVRDEPFDQVQASELRAALVHAIENALTERQRNIFVGVAIDHIPPDTLAVELETNRNAIYKSVFDARRKIRAYLVANELIW